MWTKNVKQVQRAEIISSHVATLSVKPSSWKHTSWPRCARAWFTCHVVHAVLLTHAVFTCLPFLPPPRTNTFKMPQGLPNHFRTWRRPHACSNAWNTFANSCAWKHVRAQNHAFHDACRLHLATVATAVFDGSCEQRPQQRNPSAHRVFKGLHEDSGSEEHVEPSQVFILARHLGIPGEFPGMALLVPRRGAWSTVSTQRG
jgi:hypothetical protein